ncbi:MAG: YfhO family protein [Fibrobacteres bacterium]|nr:YfhO family protein [Fibrobacterota bacterium]
MTKKKKPESVQQVKPAEIKKEFSLTDRSSIITIILLALVFFLPFIISDKMFYGSDTLNGIYSRYFYADFFEKYQSLPKVLSVTLSGMPTVEAFFGDYYYPLAILQFIFDIPRALGYKYLVTVVLAGLFMWTFLRRGLNLGREAALVGAVAFMFNTQFISHFFPGHDGKMFVISWLPLSLFAVKRLCDTAKIRYAVLLSLSVGMCILTSHIQTTYFSLWGIGLYFLYEGISALRADKARVKFIGKVAIFSLGIGLGLGIGMVQFLPPYKFTKQYSVRGTGEKTTYEHATSWSIHWEEAASFIIPEFCGFSAKDADTKTEYWGRNPFKLNSEYAGIVALLISIFGLFAFKKDKFLRFLAFMGGGALIFSLGANTPLFHLFYNFVPGVKLFRAPSMILFWMAAVLTIGAAYTINRLLSEEIPFKSRELWAKRVLIAIAICGALTLLVTAGQSVVLDTWKSIMYSLMTDRNVSAFNANYSNFVKGAWITFFIGGGALFALYLYLKDSLKPAAFIIVLLILAIADLFRVNSYFYKLINPDEYISRNEPALLSLSREAEKDYFRVLPIPGQIGNSDPQIYGLDNTLGFHDNELAWYREFTGGQQRENLFYLLQQNKLDSNPFLDLLNVKYILYRGGNSPVQIARISTALPRAFCVTDFEVTDPKLMGAKLREPGFPYRTRILLEKMPPAGYLPVQDSVPVGMASYKINVEDRIIETEMTRPGFVVVSDVYMPYWQATVNGKSTDIYKTDIAIMAVPVPAGKSTVVIKYYSPYIAAGTKITFASIVICLLLLTLDYFVIGKLCCKRKEEAAVVNV